MFETLIVIIAKERKFCNRYPSLSMVSLLAHGFDVGCWLAPGGTFVGIDSRTSLRMKIFHWFDTMVIVDPENFPERLRAAGFLEAQIEISDGAFRFCAVRP